MREAMYGLFSEQNGNFVRLVDISKSTVCKALQYSVLAFCEREGAEASKATVSELSGLRPLETRALECATCEAREPA
jgi:hypothetical protein